MGDIGSLLLKGKPVADAIIERNRLRVDNLGMLGISPKLAIVRIGENPDDCSYERMTLKRASQLGVEVQIRKFEKNVSQNELIEALLSIGRDSSVHGCLMFRPLPCHLNEDEICEALDPRKDVDGITSFSMAGVYKGSSEVFAPCTAQACIELLDYYHIDMGGKNVAVIGRSLVIGRPVALLFLQRNATITICHSHTENLAQIIGSADIVVCATGRARAYGADLFHSGQTIIDVGINFDEHGTLCGDVDYESVAPHVGAITPVPGGVGGITTAVLMEHVIRAAM